MAETKTATTSSRGRKPKTKVETQTENNTTETNQNEVIEKLMAEIASLKSQISANQQPIIVQQNSGFSGKKIKCVNLMHNPVNISTEPNGAGRVYTFEKYGDSRMIKFDELSDIVSSYTYTMENGLIYICDPNVVETFGLSDEYSKIYTKEVMDKILYLRDETDVDLFLGMEDNLKESVAIEIARLLNKNEKMDYNYLRRIKEECNIDIEKIAEDIKEESSKSTDI